MARAGVTYIQVAKAAEMLKQQALEPTVDRVREQLGTGSKSTIGPYLKKWKSGNLDKDSISGLPDELLKTVKSLHERLQGEATLKVEEVTTNLNQSISKLREELVSARSDIKELTSQNEQLTSQNQSLSKQLETTNIDNVAFELKQQQLEQETTRLTALLSEEKGEAKQVRAQYEYFQEKSAVDRQEQRNQHQLALQQSQNHIDQLNNQLKELNTDISALKTQQKESSAALSMVEKENLTLKQQLSEKNHKVDELGDKLTEKNLEIEKLIETKQKIQDDYSATLKKQLTAEKDVEYLSDTLKKTESDLSDARNKLSRLNNENKLIIQEKAIIQGQFTQLQNSL